MRPQQQGRRQRNRNSGGGNRRNQNPLSRNYESNGPDVKIRGNAQVIADKYAALARDALSSGDSVMAENYLQHAEHYNRIIMAAQSQMQAQREERQQSDDNSDSDDDSSDDTTAQDASSDNGEERPRRDRQDRKERNERKAANGDARPNGEDASEAPQPVIGETPVEVAMEEQEQAAASAPRRAPARRPRKPRRKRSGTSCPPHGTPWGLQTPRRSQAATWLDGYGNSRRRLALRSRHRAAPSRRWRHSDPTRWQVGCNGIKLRRGR